jgi:N-hydroxyarylamine O-acetyltransferase
MSLDLDAYFDRIGYEGPWEPTLPVLRQIQALHPRAIAFEGIDVLLGRGIDLSPEAVDAKLIGARRGGYCFEQNSLLGRALMALGFEVEALIARTRWARPLDDIRPRSHMALRVTIEGEPWLADAGLGVCTLTAPVRLDVAGAQPTLLDPVRIVPVEGELRLEVQIAGEWRPVVDLNPAPQHDVDFLPANWFTSTHPDSPFRQHLIVSRVTEDARYGLLDNRLAIRRRGASAKLTLLSRRGVLRALDRLFGLPVEPGWEDLVARLHEAA